SFNNGVSFVKTLFSNVMNASRQIVSKVIGRIRDHFRSVADWLRGTFGPAFAKVQEWITAPVIKARDVIRDVVGKIKHTFSDAVKSSGKIWKGLSSEERRVGKEEGTGG